MNKFFALGVALLYTLVFGTTALAAEVYEMLFKGTTSKLSEAWGQT